MYILHVLQVCSRKQASVLLCITVAKCRLANAELMSLLMASFEQSWVQNYAYDTLRSIQLSHCH